MNLLQGSVTDRSGNRLCLENSSVKVCGRGAGWSNFAWSLRIWAGVGLKIVRGSSLARISLPCGAAVVMGNIIWFVKTLRVIRWSARRSGTGQVVEQAGRLPDGKMRWFKLRFCQVLEGQGLLEQSSGAKINYFDACAARFCGGEVWGIPVCLKRSCSRFRVVGGLLQFCLVMTNLGRCWG